jgi:hypothetical protein
MPQDVRDLVSSRGTLRPLGIVSYAEADARIHAELIANIVLRERAAELPAGTATTPVVILTLARLRDHLQGWYALSTSAAFVDAALGFMREAQPEDALLCLEEVVLYLTRLDLWLDLHLPWYELNETMLRTLETKDGQN